MQLRYRLSLEAEDDLLESYVWYDNQKLGLGEDFLDALDGARDAILSNPLAYKIVYRKRVRAYTLTSFPFQILYLIEKDEVNVISVFHTSRNPKSWRKRIK